VCLTCVQRVSNLVVVDELLLEARLAVAKVEAPLPEKLRRVPELVNLLLRRPPILVPQLERCRVVQANVLDVRHGEGRVRVRTQHRAHRRQVAARENVAADEVRAPAVVLLVCCQFVANVCC
jgi:hypothetical protein